MTNKDTHHAFLLAASKSSCNISYSVVGDAMDRQTPTTPLLVQKQPHPLAFCDSPMKEEGALIRGGSLSLLTFYFSQSCEAHPHHRDNGEFISTRPYPQEQTYNG